ncbi:MAG: HAD family hydrolase [Candidatus Hodarchaeales archaeon]|jgi:phosphoglycolate phosphatase-like HAD superfamily hydrolase
MPQLVYIPIKAILFDFDGTLVDTKHFYFNIAAQFLHTNVDKLINLAEETFFSNLSPEEKNIKWKIVEAIYKVSRAQGNSRIKSARVIWHLRKNHTKQFKKAQPTRDTPLALKRLHSAGIKLAIISLSSRKKIQIFLKTHLKGLNYFTPDCILSAGEFENKELAIVHFLRKFKLTSAPRSCAIIGDLGGDIISGKTTGITTFGITTGYSSREILEHNSPDAIYDTLLEMEKSVHLFLAEEK